MTADKAQEAFQAACDRIEAVCGSSFREIEQANFDTELLPLFAGTDLPAETVQRLLEVQANGARNLMVLGVADPMSAFHLTALNCFFVGYEMGCRTEAARVAERTS